MSKNRFKNFPGKIKEEEAKQGPTPPKPEAPSKATAPKPTPKKKAVAKKKAKKEVPMKGIMFKIPESTHMLLKIMGAVTSKNQSELMTEALLRYAESINKDYDNAFAAFIKASKQSL